MGTKETNYLKNYLNKKKKKKKKHASFMESQ